MMRRAYSDSSHRLDNLGISVPPPLQGFAATVGWPDKAVSTPARRIRPDGFSLPRESALVDEIHDVFSENRMVSAERMAIHAALLHGCSFVFVTKGDEAVGEPDVVISVRDALDATAEVDSRSRRVTAALEVVELEKWVLYLPSCALTIEHVSGRGVQVVHESRQNGVPCVPYIWGKQVHRPFGKSRITRPVMAYTDMAVRTMLRQEVNAEFYISPQRYMLGAQEEWFVDEHGEPIPMWQAMIGGMLVAPDTLDEEADGKDRWRRPEVGQFAQMTMQPHTDQLRSIAMMFSGETSIPVNYLGIVQDNPASAEAINAMESDLISVVTDELASIGESREELARMVLSVRYGGLTSAERDELRGLHSEFRNPGTPTANSDGDLLVKLATAYPDLAKSTVPLERLFSASQLRRIQNDISRGQTSTLLDRLRPAADAARSNPAVAEVAV